MDSFTTRPSEDTLDLSGIVSEKQKPSYYSCTAADLGRVSCDRMVGKAVVEKKDEGGEDLLHHLIDNCISDVKFPIVFSLAEAGPWYVGLFHFDDSVAVVWPVQIKVLKAMFPTVEQVVFAHPGASPAYLMLPEWSAICVRPLVWHSHNWLCRQWVPFT